KALVALGNAEFLWGGSASNVFCDEWNSMFTDTGYHGAGGWEVKCDPHGMVTDLRVDFPDSYFEFGEAGVVREAITAFSALQTLNLGLIGYAGNLEFISLFSTKLQHVDLRFSGFNGSIPESIGNATSLTYLDLSYLAVSGSLPSSISRLTALQFLDVSFNQLNGSLPDSITRLASLQHLGLGFTNLSGPIPARLGRLISLTSLNVSGTGLTCPAEGSKCVVQQRNTTSFCHLCSPFCSSCT
ncbi:unnamed protein product, partial [Closterium sp. Naga37s-1]